jgi:hypothetical protein
MWSSIALNAGNKGGYTAQSIKICYQFHKIFREQALVFHDNLLRFVTKILSAIPYWFRTSEIAQDQTNDGKPSWRISSPRLSLANPGNL